MGRKEEDSVEVKRRRKSRSDSVATQHEATHEDANHPAKRLKHSDKVESEPAVASLHQMEEKEAENRKSGLDLQLFCNTTSKIKSLVKEIDELKNSGVKSESEDINSRRVDAMLLTSSLKKLNRLSQIRVKKAQERTEEMKQKADVLHLDLQNLLYEVVHLQKEISKCNGFMSRDEDIQLISLDEFYQQAPGAAAKKESLDSDPHQQMLARLEWELEQRKSLATKKKVLVDQKNSASSEIDAKQELLTGLQPKLDTIMQSTLPLQESLGLPLEAEKAQNETSFYLARPLYILYSQARAFREASARYMAVSILGDLQAAKAIAGRDDNVSSDESDDSDADVTGDGSDKASNKRRKHRREKEKARLEEQRKSLLKTHPLSVKLLLSCKSHVKLEVLFSYIPALHIVTVNVEVKEQSAKAPPLLLSSSLLSADTLLDELFPNDSGINTPNKANHFQLQKLRMNEFSHYITTIGKPYYWAQWICGLRYFQEADSPAIHETQFALSHQHIESVTKALRSRVQARIELQKQLASLETLTIVECASTLPLFPGKLYNSLTLWRAIPYEDFISLTFTSHLVERNMIKSTDMFYSAKFTRDDVSLSTAVAIHVDYPKTAPLFSIQLIRGDNVIRTTACQEIENEVNIFYQEFLEADKPELLLPNMLRRLQVCLDVFCEVTDEEKFGRHRLFTRPARGRDRALPLKYVPERNFYTQR